MIYKTLTCFCLLSLLNHSLCQQQLPATGVPVRRQGIDHMQEKFNEYVKSRTLQNWKFWIVSFSERALTLFLAYQYHSEWCKHFVAPCSSETHPYQNDYICVMHCKGRHNGCITETFKNLPVTPEENKTAASPGDTDRHI